MSDSMQSFWNQIFGGSGGSGSSSSSTTTTAPTSGSTPAPAPTTPTYDSKNPPPGFTSDQWRKLLDMSKKNTGLSDLMKQFTGSIGTTPASEAWRRQLPTDTTQLLRQLSFNVGEIGMPGGYVGGVQMPSYQMPGPQLPAINNPDMSKYGRQPGYGEANFYQQSMKGGMTPIAAMSPLGVPEGWAPGGKDLKSQLEDYLKKIRGDDGDDDDDGDGGGGGGMSRRGNGIYPQPGSYFGA